MAKPIFCTPFITLFALFILLTITPSHSNNHTDLEALLAFKKFINNDPLLALSSWNETTHFCRWNGISCSKRHPNRVVSVSLRSQGLMGWLSPHVGNLSFLKTMDLQNNSFRGTIPQEIGRLRRLRVIEFSKNSFVGGIPTNLSQCIHLYHLNLIDNKLSGGIVPEIASLVNLQSLGLSENMLSGNIPPVLGNLTNLLQLGLGNCGLLGEIPESLVKLRRLWRLNMYENNLTGSVPIGLYNISSLAFVMLNNNQLHGNIPSFTLPNLRALGLAFNRFTGELPASMSNSSMLEFISVSSNNFTVNIHDFTMLPALQYLLASSSNLKGDIHTIISSLTNCTHLRVLELSLNHFTGPLPESIGNLSSQLSFLNIRHNQLSGRIPSSIGDLVRLTVFSASSNSLEGPIPWSIGKLHSLQEIYLGQNRLTNEMPVSFGNLTLLNYLNLQLNNLSGSIPRSLGNCTNLLFLDLSDNNLSGSIPSEIMSISSLNISLNLSYNALTSTIPSEVGSMINLGTLDLSHNRLSGTIPSEVGAMSNLWALDLSHNRLSGTIPSEVGTIFYLGVLDLSYNRLSGTIPSSLGRCFILNQLLLARNSLQGKIPDGIRTLKSLRYLDLSQNNFSGMIPRYLAEFHTMLYLNLSFNMLKGEVPILGVFLNENAISLQGNNGLCGGIATLNLPSCSSSQKINKKSLGKILIPTVVGAICLGLVACFCVIITYRRHTLQNVGTSNFQVPDFLRLSYADLLSATSGFSEANLIGAGIFGSVYKGTINDDDDEQTDVAVKVLNLNLRGASKSFASECNALRNIRHKNLLKIVSVCDSTDYHGNDFKALVYEFVANGSLENWLHYENEGRGALSAIQRLNIAIDIASAVEYMHCGTDSIVIHGDLKPSNVLLDKDMVAKVGDFGLAKIVSQSLSSTEGSSSSAIKGTIGYIVPEYGVSLVATTEGDVYSYGVLVLEMFTNKRPTSDAFEGCLNLQDFVSTALTDHVTEVVDPFLHQELNVDEKYWDCVVSVLRIGVRCSKQLPRDRMSMAEVVNNLKKIKKVFPAYRNG